MWTFTQLVSGFGFVLRVKFPDPYASVMDALGSINLTIMQLAPFECLRPEATFLTSLVASTLVPIFLSFVLIALHAKGKRAAEGDQDGEGPYFSLFLLLTYLVLPNMSSQICSSFKTDQFEVGDGDKRYYLSVDYAIEAPGYNSPCKLDGSGCDWGGSTFVSLQVYAVLVSHGFQK